jgi:cobalamin biosynthesis protein CobD/CbiB
MRKDISLQIKPVTKIGRMTTCLKNLWYLRLRSHFHKYFGYLLGLMSFTLLCCELSTFTIFKWLPINFINFIINLNIGYYTTQVIFFI